MTEKELEIVVRLLVENVNLYSRTAERAKKRNFHMIEQDYFSRILGLHRLMFHLGYTLEHDGKRADCGEGADPIEYMHYKAIER